MGAVTVGIDLGQRRDPTAVCVADQQTRMVERHPEAYYEIRYLTRLELGTPYPAVAQRIAEIVSNLKARSVRKLTIYADATGVGLPVVDLLKAAGVPAIPCLFNHGDKRKREEGRVSIGKAWLVSRLQALLSSGCILLPKTEEARVLADELINFEIRLSEDADFKAGAFKVGTHDDLVTALGLAVQTAVLIQTVAPRGRTTVSPWSQDEDPEEREDREASPASPLRPQRGPRLGRRKRSHW